MGLQLNSVVALSHLAGGLYQQHSFPLGLSLEQGSGEFLSPDAGVGHMKRSREDQNRMEKAYEVLKEMREHGFLTDAFTYIILIERHSRGTILMTCMLAFFDEAIERGLQINNYTCGILLNGLCNEGDS